MSKSRLIEWVYESLVLFIQSGRYNSNMKLIRQALFFLYVIFFIYRFSLSIFQTPREKLPILPGNPERDWKPLRL